MNLGGKVNQSKKSLWITWETQRRNHELAQAFTCDFYVFDYSNLSSFNRYLKSSIKTINCLFSKPNQVFVQCPSLILCLLASILKPVLHYTLIVDAHNAILRYIGSSNPLVRFVTAFVLKQCDFIIITNSGIGKILPIEKNKILILPDKLPDIKICKERPNFFSNTKLNVVFISSFANDEPIEEFLNAAIKLTEQCKFFITGRKSKAKELLKFEQENIVFTDFLSHQDYEKLIANSDLNIDLTTENDLLVCGAYETLAVEIPGLLSDTEITREIFKSGFAYTKCDSQSIYNSIGQITANIQNYKNQIKAYKSEFASLWEQYFADCLLKISKS